MVEHHPAHDPAASPADFGIKTPVGTYYLLFAAIAALIVLTVGLSFADLGALRPIVHLGIAAVQVVLLTLVFMHVRESDPLIWLVIVAGLFWTGLLFMLTLQDYLTRQYGAL